MGGDDPEVYFAQRLGSWQGQRDMIHSEYWQWVKGGLEAGLLTRNCLE